MLDRNIFQWEPEELAAWQPSLTELKVSEWADNYRVLPSDSAIPGRWNNHITPYLVDVMNSFLDPKVEKITILASVQSGKTEAVYNMLGWSISQDPGPALIVMPTASTLKRVNKRIRNMLYLSPDLNPYLTSKIDDIQMSFISLKHVTIYFATAGSEAELQNIQARYIICDEIDEYPFTKTSGDIVQKAIDRSTSFLNRKIVLISRPTTVDGYIYKSFQSSYKKFFYIPCPYCNEYQVLEFSQIVHTGYGPGEWPQDYRNSEYILSSRPARYVCKYCQEEIDDYHKPDMLLNGLWVPEDREILPNGTIEPYENKRHIGYYWNSLYSPFKSFSEIMAQFFMVKDEPDKLKVFISQWIAEPWEEQREYKNEYKEYSHLITSLDKLTVPKDTIGLTAGIDVQKDSYYYVILAWIKKNNELSQHVVDYGIVDSLDNISELIFEKRFLTEDGKILKIFRAGIDTGGGYTEADISPTETLYSWLRNNSRGIIFGIKGLSKELYAGKRMKLSIIDRYPSSNKPIPGGLRLWLLDGNALKDALFSRLEQGKITFHSKTTSEFFDHLNAEYKVSNKRGKYVYKIKYKGTPNHYLDCMVYALAMGDQECWGGVLYSKPTIYEPERREHTQPVARKEESRINPLTGKRYGSWFR